jgi:hypothetical protein
MKGLFATCALACSLLIGQPAFAAATWLYGVTIKTVYPYTDGSFVVTLSSSPSSCTNTGSPDKNFYVTVNAAPNGNTTTETGARNLFALALQASAMTKTVDVLFDSSTSNCYIGAMILHS